ncbi:MAG: cell division initiation protein, partial [Actinomycetes bacterium]
AEGVRAQARVQADEIVAAAHEERMVLVSHTEILAQAEREAGRIIASAEQEAASMHREIDDYIDAKLANFEIVLSKTMEAVNRGREKIQGRRAVEQLADLDLSDPDASPEA